MHDITNQDTCSSGSTVADANAPKTTIIVDREDDTDISDPFPFPTHYQPDIELGIKLRALQPNQVVKFITRIANVMFLYKRYPKKCEYERVAQQVVKKYSFLESPVHPYVSLLLIKCILHVCIQSALPLLFQGHIVKGLQDRFREFRRKKPVVGAASDMKVEFRFKRDPLSTTAGPIAKKPKLEQPIPAGKDSTSFFRHKLLLSESTKAHLNKAVVSEAMKLSFAMR